MRKYKSFILWLLIVTAVWGAFIFLMHLFFHIEKNDNAEKTAKPIVEWITANEFGDMFGCLSCLFSGLAFAGLLYTIYLQINESAKQDKRSQIDRDVDEFFRRLEYLKQLERDIEYKDGDAVSYKGRAAVERLYEEISKINLNKNGGYSLYRELHFSPAFITWGSFYINLLKDIDSRYFYNEEEKDAYASVLNTSLFEEQKHLVIFMHKSGWKGEEEELFNRYLKESSLPNIFADTHFQRSYGIKFFNLILNEAKTENKKKEESKKDDFVSVKIPQATKEDTCQRDDDALGHLSPVYRAACIAEKTGLCYTNDGSAAYNSRARYQPIERAKFYQVLSGAIFCDAEGREYNFNAIMIEKDRVGQRRTWEAAKRKIAKIGEEEAFQPYAEELNMICEHTLEKQFQKMPSMMRECFLAEIGNMLCHPSGGSGYLNEVDIVSIKGTEKTMEIKRVADDAFFYDSRGNAQSYDAIRILRQSDEKFVIAWYMSRVCVSKLGSMEVLKKYSGIVNKMNDNYKRGYESYIQNKNKDIEDAKKSLDSLPAHMRRACLAEVEKMVWMTNGLSPYTGQRGHINAYGCSYDYPRLRAGVCFRDIDRKVYDMQDILEERRKNPLYHMNWIKAQYYLYTCDKEEILKNYASEIERLKESNEREIRMRKKAQSFMNYIAAEKANYDRTTRH